MNTIFGLLIIPVFFNTISLEGPDYPSRKVKITVNYIYCIDPHDKGSAIPDLNIEDNIYMTITNPSESWIPKTNRGTPGTVGIKRGQSRGPYVLWEGFVEDNEEHDIQVYLRNNNRVQLGRFDFKLQNRYGYVLVDWRGNYTVSFNSSQYDRNIRGRMDINTIEYPGSSTNVKQKAVYRFYDYEGRDDDNPEDDLEETSTYEVELKVEVLN